MEKDLIERLHSEDLEEGLEALAQVVYDFSKRHGSIYVTSSIIDDSDRAIATAQLKGEESFINSLFIEKE